MRWKVGEIIGNSTLCVYSTHYNKMICKCSKCNKEDVYTEDDLNNYLGCKICFHANRARIELKPTTDMIRCDKLYKNYIDNKYRNNCSVISRAPFKGINIGDYIGDLVVTEFIGKINTNNMSIKDINSVILTCPLCNYYKRIVTIDNIINKEYKRDTFKCQHCGPKVTLARNSVEQLRANKQSHISKILSRREDRLAKAKDESKNEVFQEETIYNNTVLNKPDIIYRVKSPLDNYKKGSDIFKITEKIKKENPSLTIQDIEKCGSTFKVNCTCVKCGTELSIPRTKVAKNSECPGCKIKKTNFNYIGAYNKNNIGNVRNLMELLERNSETCKVKCTTCGREYENIKYYDWYKGKIICNCAYNTIKMENLCKVCGEWVDVQLSKLIQGKGINNNLICNNCKAEGRSGDSGIPLQELIDKYITTPSIAITTQNKLGVARRNIKDNTENINNTIIKSKTPLYFGTDDNAYYKCRCLIHDTDLILNDDEISVFSHNQCSDLRQHIMKDIEASNIKL